MRGARLQSFVPLVSGMSFDEVGLGQHQFSQLWARLGNSNVGWRFNAVLVQAKADGLLSAEQSRSLAR
jgi:hypothetical protein